jgi:DNA invertase Pin-like site-specific DNA recombinase
MKEKQTGELNGNARLRKEDILEIKQMLKDGIKQAIIANKFGISETHIYNIKHGLRWSSVTGGAC